MGVPSLDDLLDLVALTYEVAASGPDWDPLLAATARAFDGSAAVFFVHDRREPGLAFARLWGRPGAALEQFENHFAAVDVGLDTLLEKPPMTVISDEDIPSGVFRRSEILNDFRRPWDVERFVGGDVFRDGRRFGVLSVQGSRDRGPFSHEEREAVGRLLPHLARAVQMRAQLDGLQVRQGLLEDLIEGLPVGVFVLDERGIVTHANAAARCIERLRDGLTIRDRRLRVASAAEDSALTRAIAAAIGTTRRVALEGGGALRVTRPSGGRPWPLLVCPGPGSDSDSPFRPASAIVLIGDVDSRIEVSAARVARLYALTGAQSRLACAIAAGTSIESYAEQQGIAVSTARWTLKQVLARTGASRQADLVRMLLTGPAALKEPPADPHSS